MPAYAVLRVTDTGIGIDPEAKPHLFEPFFTTKEVGKGTGLGLSVIYGIVKSHKGEVQFKSEPSIGSVFEVWLPRAEALPKEDPNAHESSGGSPRVRDDSARGRRS